VLDPERDAREPRDLSSTVTGARRLARDLRLETWSEHLDLPREQLVDPVAAWDVWRERADALDAWHAGGRRGPRPPGQVRRHRPDPVSRLQRLWAEPVYRLVFDPDGRPRSLRRSGRF
jgi:hypothetical protein